MADVKGKQYTATVMPNPFCSNATLLIDLNTGKTVKIELYDMAGRLLNTLSNGMMAVGEHRLPINTCNTNTSGMYYIRITVDNETYNIKVVYLGQ